MKVGLVEGLARVNSWNVDPSLMLRVSAFIRRLVGRPEESAEAAREFTEAVAVLGRGDGAQSSWS